MIKQMFKFKDLIFEEGDILKITIELEGTKNLYIGKFLYFEKSFALFGRKRRTNLVFRHHTLCEEGVFKIEDNEIINIEKLQCKKK